MQHTRLHCIKSGLQSALINEGGDLGDSEWEIYAEYCLKSLRTHGFSCFSSPAHIVRKYHDTLNLFWGFVGLGQVGGRG